MDLKNENNLEIKENELKYKLFILVDNDLEDVNQLYEKLIDYTEFLSESYIWNNEKFYLSKPVKCEIISETERFLFYCCDGVVDYGDNLGDEWFIVYLLLNLTIKFSYKLAAQVNDADGEFLLIQSANYLPKWASSAADNCMNNRVFLFNGELHMIPPAEKPSEITYLPAAGPIQNILNGVKIVFDFPKLTCAAATIQECIKKKLSPFEKNLQSTCFHRATCTIPTKLVWLLNNNPSLISAAVNRFCDKDPNDLKTCRFLNNFKPVDLVNYRVTFTKHLYGKLKYCDFKPDKRHNWPSLNELVSLSNSQKIQAESKTQNTTTLIRERSMMGFKLTCAFEILMNNLTKSHTKSFETYINKLKNLGYFRNYLENSKKYNQLMSQAIENFEHETQEKSKTTNQKGNYAEMFESFYLNNLPSDEYFVKLKEEINIEQEKTNDDNEDWLFVDAPCLDDYLELYSKGDVSSTYDFKLLSDAFKRFLSVPKIKKNLLDGVEFDSIEKIDDKLIDFNLECVEDNLKDLLKIDKPDKKTNVEESEDENDSFYEIEDDLIDENEELKTTSKNLKTLMDSMDKELENQKDLSRLDTKNNEQLELDINLVSNALESYSSQLGLTGPVSNILKSLGL